MGLINIFNNIYEKYFYNVCTTWGLINIFNNIRKIFL